MRWRRCQESGHDKCVRRQDSCVTFYGPVSMKTSDFWYLWRKRGTRSSCLSSVLEPSLHGGLPSCSNPDHSGYRIPNGDQSLIQPFSFRYSNASFLVSKTFSTQIFKPENEYPLQRYTTIPVLPSPSTTSTESIPLSHPHHRNYPANSPAAPFATKLAQLR
jgi:hypothetical protein